MYLHSVEIHNYKGFKDCFVEFHPRLNVFIGSNASGKTTLLTALLKTIYSLTREFVSASDEQNLQLTVDDINYSAGFCDSKLVIKAFPGYASDIISVIVRNRPGSAPNNNLIVEQDLKYPFINWYRQRLQQSVQTVPIFKFYPANRGSIQYSQHNQDRVYQISQLEAWSNLYQGSLSYSRFFNWFFDNETNELRLQRDAHDFSVESNELKGVRHALTQAFELLGYGTVKVKSKQIKRFNSSKLTPTLVIENVENHRIDEIENKSDGEKAIITLVADIAYNLSLAKDFTFDDEFLNSPGVVIIDEIESHLHPNWQREILPILTKLFPNLQFFIATHSPQVVSSVNSESIYVCQDFQVEKIGLKTKGEDTNTLLKHIFNSTERPKEYVDLIKNFYWLIESNSEDSAIEEVIKKIGEIEKEDKATDINSLIEELKLQFEAYKFDRDYEANK